MSEVDTLAEPVDEKVYCVYADRKHKKRGKFALRLQGQGVFVVCGEHKYKLEQKHADVRCKHCGVPIKGFGKKAIPGFHHQPGCPHSKFDRILVEVPD